MVAFTLTNTTEDADLGARILTAGEISGFGCEINFKQKSNSKVLPGPKKCSFLISGDSK